ncbi:hypothetical protein CK203_087029 [Vitis vinifera]|uniref:Reverse transcriptase/retrotransposon-derived protein RNase H-like domain-containing protein n=1 Tax=Vitis vinifera TaxID=29760 RepID=A0A438CLV2_VITVI|nr:hypothetical protein CK203_087029 [Vitis vinifera]
MKFNPAKCAFGVSTGKFLGFTVTKRGIEVNLAQVKAILEMSALNGKKELQRLTDCLAALGRFIAHFTNKLRPFFLTLKEASTFSWTNECEQAFKAVKHYLIEPLILSNPKSNEELYMYMAISNYAMSFVLLRHIGNKK